MSPVRKCRIVVRPRRHRLDAQGRKFRPQGIKGHIIQKNILALAQCRCGNEYAVNRPGHLAQGCCNICTDEETRHIDHRAEMTIFNGQDENILLQRIKLPCLCRQNGSNRRSAHDSEAISTCSSALLCRIPFPDEAARQPNPIVELRKTIVHRGRRNLASCQKIKFIG